MDQGSPLVAIIVVGIGLAFVFGALANRLRISPIVGYLLAGVAVGPFTPGFVADPALAPQLAQIGVILLMFGVGLHFSLRDLLALWKVVVPGALLQIAVSTLFGIGIAWLLGWSPGAALSFGLALSISSTVVLTRALQARHLVDTDRGHIAVGWLIVQDMVVVMALVLLPPLALALQTGAGEPGNAPDLNTLGRAFGMTLARLVAFIALMLVIGRRIIPAMLHYVAHTGSRELFRLAVLAVALVVAFLASELFGVSLALGAFFAGMILSESELSQRAAEESLPLRDAFAVLFFVSIGMLFDPGVLLREPLPLLGMLLAILLGNGGVAFLMVRLFRYPLGTALTVGAGLAQIGEFSFVLADLGIGLGLLTGEARVLLLGASIISIFVNPALFAAADLARRRLAPPAIEPQAKPAEVRATDGLVPSGLTGHTVLVGYGRVGQLVGDNIVRDGRPLLVIEDATDAIEKLHEKGIEVIAGNAAEAEVLAAANIAAAQVLIVAIPNGFEAGQIVEQARAANPNLEIIARAHFDAEVEHLQSLGADMVIMGEREIARSMIERMARIAPNQQP